jgi:hypothetical protein
MAIESACSVPTQARDGVAGRGRKNIDAVGVDVKLGF